MGLLGSIGKALTSVVGGTPVGMLLNAGTSLIGSVISNNQQKANQNRQNEWQAEQSEIARNWQAEQAQLQNQWSEKMNLQQQNWQEDMWNKNNEYNTPQAQMERLMDAGINPNNAAGLVSGSASQSQMAQQPTIPSANPYPGTNIPAGGQMAGPTMLDAMNSMANARLTNAQAENIEIQNGYQEQISQATVDNLIASTNNLISSSNLSNEQQTSLREFQNKLTEQMTNKTYAEAQEITQKYQNLLKEYDSIDQQIQNAKQELANLKDQQKQIQANTSLLYQEANESRSRQEYNAAQTENARKTGEGIDIDNQIKEKDKELKGLEVDRQKSRNNVIRNTGIDPENQNAYNTATRLVNKAMAFVKNPLKRVSQKVKRSRTNKKIQVEKKKHNISGAGGTWN